MFLALGLLAVTTAVTVRAAVARAGGHFVYTLDDTYIYMAIAKNLVTHGVWGTTRFGFASATSSPLWLLLLAGSYAIAGVNAVAPLVLDLAFAALLLVVSYRVLRAFDVAPNAIAGVLAALIFLVPMVPVAMCGLEHFMHAAAALAFAALAATADLELRDRRRQWQLALVAALMVAARYEGPFLVAAVVVPLAWRRRFGPALAITAAALVPVVAYAVLSTSHGWLPVPSSVLLKAQIPRGGLRSLPDMVEGYVMAVLFGAHLIVILMAGAGLLAYIRRRVGHLRDPASRMLALTLVATTCHLLVARVGAFYRYEAYLVALWIVTVGCNLSVIRQGMSELARGGPRHVAIGACVLLAFAVPFVARGVTAHIETPKASRNIYEQQVQMGLFLRDFHAGHRVAANDIGAINYFGDIDNLDLAGLGTAEIMRARLAGRYRTPVIDELTRARGMEMAIVYDEWFDRLGGLPRSWVKVGEWTIHDNVIAARDTVAFYATTPAHVAHVASTLRAFAPRLPPRVDQRGLYLEAR